MDKNARLMAQELPDDEMKLLYSLLGKGPVKNPVLRRRSRFWKWRSLIRMGN